jgi:hypothetical protein
VIETDILHRAAAAGVRLYVDAGRIMAVPKGVVTDELRELIRAHKPALLKVLRAPVSDVSHVLDVAEGELGSISESGRAIGTSALVDESASSAFAGDEADLEALQARALAVLAANPMLRFAVVVDDADADPVQVGVAIREKGSCVVQIPAARFNPFELLDLVARHGGSAH